MKEAALLQAYQQLQGSIVARANLSGMLGQQYSGSRDLYEALGYRKVLLYQDFIDQYLRQDIAKAVIDRPVKVTWSGALRIVESNNDKETDLEKAWEDLETELSLKPKFIRLDKLTGLGRYGVLLLGFDDIKVQLDFIKPVAKGSVKKLMYVKPLGESGAVISTWVTDPQDPRYGLPLTYDVTLLDPNGTGTQQMKVHYSRVIHVIEGGLESETEGSPRLEVVFNRLMDLEKLVGGSAEMFWRGARPGYTAKVDKEYQLGDTEETALLDQISEYEHNLRRILLSSGIDMTPLAQQVSDPKNHVDVQLMMISAVTGIPKRILSGSERGELASSQDSIEWSSYIQNRREEFAEPQIIRPFVDRLIELGILPAATDGYTIEWADLFSISEKEKVDIGRERATALKEYFSSPMAAEVVSPDSFFQFFLGLTTEQIELIKEQAAAAQELSMQDEETQMKLEEETLAAAREQIRKEQEAAGAPPLLIPAPPKPTPVKLKVLPTGGTPVPVETN